MNEWLGGWMDGWIDTRFLGGRTGWSGVSAHPHSGAQRESEAGHFVTSQAPPRPPRPRSVFPSADSAAHLVALPFKTRSPGAHLRAGASAGRRKRRHRRLPALPPHPPGPPAATMSASAVFILDVKGKVRLGAGNGRPTAGGCSLSDPACGPSSQAARSRKALGAWGHPSPNSWDSGV